MFKNFTSLFYYKYPIALVSLIHASRYNSSAYLKQVHKTKDFTKPLHAPAPKNKRARLLVTLISLGILLQIAAGIVVIALGLSHQISGGLFFGIAIIILYPIVWAYIPFIALLMRDWYKQGLSLNES